MDNEIPIGDCIESDLLEIKHLYRTYGMDYVEDDGIWDEQFKLDSCYDEDEIEDFEGNLRVAFHKKIPDGDNQF